MTKEQLKRAKLLDEEIRMLDRFIHTVGCCLEGELSVKKKKWFFSNVPYGIFEKKTLECNSALKSRINELILNYKNELTKELENL